MTKNLQTFVVVETGGKKMKLGAILTPDEKTASPARFSFAATPVENITDAVHKLNISTAKEQKDYYAVIIGIEKYRNIKRDAMYELNELFTYTDTKLRPPER